MCIVRSGFNVCIHTVDAGLFGRTEFLSLWLLHSHLLSVSSAPIRFDSIQRPALSPLLVCHKSVTDPSILHGESCASRCGPWLMSSFSWGILLYKHSPFLCRVFLQSQAFMFLDCGDMLVSELLSRFLLGLCTALARQARLIFLRGIHSTGAPCAFFALAGPLQCHTPIFHSGTQKSSPYLLGSHSILFKRRDTVLPMMEPVHFKQCAHGSEANNQTCWDSA